MSSPAICFCILLIIVFIFWNSPTKPMASLNSLPLPFAILSSLLLADLSVISRSGFAFSFLVMLCIMASDFFSLSSAVLSILSSIFPAIPGIILATPAKLPILLTSLLCFMKSSKSKVASFILSAIFMASASDTSALAFSTRLMTSPIPRILLAILFGKKASISLTPSPVPMNLMSFPLTALILTAAPPLLSPSVLVRTAPVSPTARSKDLVVSAAS
mmetsp:Transcript_7926/g.15914  ORF Transcript_7926/g.15914 Transcript_7926/m.15914 type:complete len:217 (+) Transcript_7926:135-785(+)